MVDQKINDRSNHERVVEFKPAKHRSYLFQKSGKNYATDSFNRFSNSSLAIFRSRARPKRSTSTHAQCR